MSLTSVQFNNSLFTFSLYMHIMYIFFKNAEEMSSHAQDGAYFRIMLIKCIFFLFLHTVTFLLDGLGLRNGKALHRLVFLLLRLVLVRLLRVLAVRVDQHSAVECVAVSSGTLTGPRDAIHCGERKEC